MYHLFNCQLKDVFRYITVVNKSTTISKDNKLN